MGQAIIQSTMDTYKNMKNKTKEEQDGVRGRKKAGTTCKWSKLADDRPVVGTHQALPVGGGESCDSREERWRGGAGLAHENRGEFSEGFYPAHHSPTKLYAVCESGGTHMVG